VYIGFPLLAGNAFDKLLYPFCTIPFHLVRYILIDIQRKGDRRMVKSVLYGLNIIPAFNRGDSVTVAVNAENTYRDFENRGKCFSYFIRAGL
jgi:hypothetical protein